MKKALFLLVLLVAIALPYVGNAATDCMVCHQWNIGVPAINASLFGSHIDINTTGGAGNLTSDDCTSCHYDTSVMSSVSTYTCEDCHINGVVPSAPRVYNHTRNTGISVNAFCSDCHNKTSNLFKYSNNASAAHYGRNSSFGLSPGEQYCIFCHQNSSTAYKDVMQNPNNNRVSNHTSGIIFEFHPAGGKPTCTSCHGQDRIHGTNINKPVPNSGFCNSCHNSDVLQKNMHNGNIECIRCHTDTPWDIHNIKYVLYNGSYIGINATGCGDCHNFSLPAPYFRLPFSAADCTACHQGSGLIRFAEAPRIPAPMRHSTNSYSGALWNGSQSSYWSNSSQLSACRYCHGNTIHTSVALGKIENIRSGNSPNQSITNTSYWCANCHYMNVAAGNYSYSGSSYSPVPPEIQNKTGLMPVKANDGTNFFNHSITAWSDNVCQPCHSVNSSVTTASFVHNIAAGGGGANCISCHDITATGAPPDKRIDISTFNRSIHYGLNGGGSSACWACHGDGTQPDGHPANYKSPKRCSNDECHSLDQKYRAPMIYSHFRNANLNNNPDNSVNFNVTTRSNCEECHINSVAAQDRSIYSTVSHYGSLELPDSINCIYCHLNKNNSEKWGNATLINENRTTLAELDRSRNKFIVKAGESIDLGFKFRLKVLDISSAGESALIELLKDNVTVDRSLVNTGNYTYEENLTINGSSEKLPVIALNITEIFTGDNISFIQFEGFRLRRVHAENKTTSCYMCHIYSRPRVKYKVIDRVDDEDIAEIFYTNELVNLTDKKEYNESAALLIIANLSDNDMNVNIGPGTRKALFQDEPWNISEDTSLVVENMTITSDEALLKFRAGKYSYEDIVKKGGLFEYSPGIKYQGNQPKNVTIFRARVSEIIQAEPKNMVILEDVVALSPDIKKIEGNKTLEGYNASWLWKNSTLVAGRIPENFHSPQLFDGRDGGGDCLSCHGRGGFVEKRIISLGRHERLNGGGNNACYACHGGSKEIKTHPSGYKTPRDCRSCHASAQNNYSAVYIGDEEHKNEKCESCHISGSHDIIRLGMLPSVKDVTLMKQGNKTIVKASAYAGYKMRIRDARYYIDSPAEKFRMYPVDRAFDSQKEEISAEIDVSKISQGKHMMYVEAMERKDKWGTPDSVAIKFENGELKVEAPETPGIIPLLGISAIAFIALLAKLFSAWYPESNHIIRQGMNWYHRFKAHR